MVEFSICKEKQELLCSFTIDGLLLEGMQMFVYLGGKVTTDGNCDQDINARASKANQAFAML
jgi:hypothetical protein